MFKKIKQYYSDMGNKATSYLLVLLLKKLFGEMIVIPILELLLRSQKNKIFYSKCKEVLKSCYSACDMNEQLFSLKYEQYVNSNEGTETDFAELIYLAGYTRNLNNYKNLNNFLNLKSYANSLQNFAKAMTLYAYEKKHEYREVFVASANQGLIEEFDKVPRYIYWSNNFRQNGFFNHERSVKLYDEVKFIDNLTGLKKYFEDQHYIILVTCDELYFNIFHQLFIQRINVENSVKVLFIVSVDSDIPRKNYISNKYAVVYEKLIFGKTWTSLSRLIHAAEIISLFSKELFIFDIDVNVYFSLDRVRGYTLDQSADMLLYQQNYLQPWNNIACGAMLITNTANSINFFKKLSSGIQEIYSENGTWTLDQTALTMAIDDLKSILNLKMIGDFQRFFNHQNLVKAVPVGLGSKKTKAKGTIDIYGSEVRTLITCFDE